MQTTTTYISTYHNKGTELLLTIYTCIYIHPPPPVALAQLLFHTSNYFLMTTTTTATTQLNKLPLSTLIFRTTDNTNVFLITTQIV